MVRFFIELTGTIYAFGVFPMIWPSQILSVTTFHEVGHLWLAGGIFPS